MFEGGYGLKEMCDDAYKALSEHELKETMRWESAFNADLQHSQSELLRETIRRENQVNRSIFGVYL